jgi:hypothetical protein
MDETDNSPENLRDRLAMLDDRIARMHSLNVTHGDVMALRLIESAKAEQKMLRARLPGATSKR